VSDRLSTSLLVEFCVLLTVHLVTVLANNQLDARFFFSYICLFQFSTCFDQPYAHHQEGQLYQYNRWYLSLYEGDRVVCKLSLHTTRCVKLVICKDSDTVF